MHYHPAQLQLLIDAALKEDIGNGDHSTLSCIPANLKGKAELKIKQHGILAGVDVAKKIFHTKDATSDFISYKNDGDIIHPGEKAFEINGFVHTILQCERLVLNCMQRMTGIATLTNQYVNKLKGFKTKVLDTRKTTPNFRLLEKEAVRIGGGMNHRMGLFDMIMLKDNHIDYCGGIENAIEKAYEYVRSRHLGLKIEIETRNIEEIKKVVAIGKVDRVMLDNFSPTEVAEAVKLIENKFETEVSGGVNLDNIIDYAKTGVDYVSVGALIHQAQSVDLSLKAVIS